MALKRICPNCDGDGCVFCRESGLVWFGILEDILGLVLAYEILDATDATEYNALSDANKDAYGLIISCGMVNLLDGSPSRTKLWNIFGEGTDTRTNLEILVTFFEIPEEPEP